MGISMIGGTVTTRGGLIFVGAALERAFRAFDVRDGRKLWEAPLPEAAVATPISYLGPTSGKQFIAVAAGGRFGIMGASGEYVIAYGLP
jgi:quinoprotein glucose dehydrogenase